MIEIFDSGEDISEEKLLQPGLERADCLHRDVSTTLPGGNSKCPGSFFHLIIISSEDQDTTARE